MRGFLGTNTLHLSGCNPRILVFLISKVLHRSSSPFLDNREHLAVLTLVSVFFTSSCRISRTMIR